MMAAGIATSWVQEVDPTLRASKILHYSEVVPAKDSLRQAKGMTLLWLPNRSPKLNPMDTLWGQAKDVISANGQYTTIEEHVGRFLDYVTGLTNGEALHTSGVLSRKFWLKSVLSN
jgi:hypothetical protein